MSRSLLLIVIFVLVFACGKQSQPSMDKASEEHSTIEAGQKDKKKEEIKQEVLSKAHRLQSQEQFAKALEVLDSYPWLRSDRQVRILRAEIEEQVKDQAVARDRDPEFNLKLVGGQGQVDFVLAGDKLRRQPDELEGRLRSLCDSRRAEWCQMMAWADQKYVPKGLPMSDRSLKEQIAQYNKNRATGYDCFFLMKNGEMVEGSRSAGCS